MQVTLLVPFGRGLGEIFYLMIHFPISDGTKYLWEIIDE